jgi:hypothetical protein
MGVARAMGIRSLTATVLALTLCASGRGEPIIWDNSDATFVWGSFEGPLPGLNIDESPAENAAGSSWQLFYVREWTNPTDPDWEGISPPFWGVIVETRDFVIPGDPPTVVQRTKSLKSLWPGNVVGPAQTFTSTGIVYTRLYSPTMGSLGDVGERPIMGVRFTIGPNTHYGFVVLQLRDETNASLATYQPIAWGYESTPDTPITVVLPERCLGDVNDDGQVGLADLTLLLFFFGQTSEPGDGSDIDLDGDIDLQDLQALLFNFGDICP